MRPPDLPTPTLLGILCGTGAAVFWAAGFAAARHGIDIGFAPMDLVVHRFLWAGFVLVPLTVREGIADLGGVGWGRAVILTLLCGPLFSLICLQKGENWANGVWMTVPSALSYLNPSGAGQHALARPDTPPPVGRDQHPAPSFRSCPVAAAGQGGPQIAAVGTARCAVT